ncbi:MAG: BrnA antitoxin family protein [Beijerinckiaceae bacterium]|nr:BrnA antitoxin family protein [Beijerinckiaceae bacterium]
MRDEGLDETAASPPVDDAFDPDFWARAKVVYPSHKASIHLRIDNEVLDWFKSQGPGHLTRMNSVLKGYYEAHRKRG